jgi:hypothetical protein
LLPFYKYPSLLLKKPQNKSGGALKMEAEEAHDAKKNL